MDRSEIIIGMKVGHESGHSQTDDFEPGSPRNDGINKVKIEIFLCMQDGCQMLSRTLFCYGQGYTSSSSNSMF